MKWLHRNVFILLDIAKFVGIMALILMFINFNAKVVTQTKTTQNIVKSQSEILDAIKQLATDNKITSEQKANLIICMLQVPVEQRTTNTLENCKKQVTGEAQTPLATSPSQTPSTSPSEQKTPPQSQPKITKSITDFVSKTLKKVGL